jgi:hypothetical protein
MAMTTLRDHLLDGVQIATHECGETVLAQLAALGARVVPASGEGTPDVLVCGIGSLGELDDAWPVIQAAAAESFIPAAAPPDGTTRKVLLIGPRPGAGDTEPARAALENLARTLSVEWARFGIVAAMIAPGTDTSDEEVATLVAFLCSRAGHYYSGCRFSLGVVTESQ